MRSVRGLGGKFGERVERLVVEHGGVSDAARTAASGAGRGSSYEGGFLAWALGRVPSDVFRREFDAKTADWLARVSVGEDIEPVVPNVRDGAKSLCAFKSFAAVTDRPRVHRWLRVLSRRTRRETRPRIDCDRDARRNYSDWSTAPNSKRRTCETGKRDAWDN